MSKWKKIRLSAPGNLSNALDGVKKNGKNPTINKMILFFICINNCDFELSRLNGVAYF